MLINMDCDFKNKVKVLMLKLANLPTITTGGGPTSRLGDRGPDTTLLVESLSSGIMWAAPRKYSVTARTKQPSNRRAFIFLWNKSYNNGCLELMCVSACRR